MKHLFNVIIIGGGVVGNAVARELSRFQITAALLEKEPDVGMETSCRNSGVLHSGINYKAGTLRAKLAVRGNSMMDRLCADLKVKIKRIGKLTTALDEDELPGVKRLMEAAGLTQERVAERLGKSRPAVANLLRLLTLPEEVQKMLVDGRLTAGHARALVSVDPSRQVQLANLTVQQNWSVRQLERICAQPVKPAPKPRPRPDRELTELEDMARDLFGTRAKIDGDKNRGKLVISYYSADDLQRIWEALEAARR